MAYPVAPLAQLMEQLERLPGVGHKSAQRIAYHLLALPPEEVNLFADTVKQAREKIHECRVCCNYTDTERCPICNSTKRDVSTICVVEEPADVLAFERTREYNGLYHVLHGTLSPMDGIGPNQLRIRELLARLTDERVHEVIMATNPTVEGEATAMYLVKLLKPFEINVTRLAYGIPVGGDLEYADEVTLLRALEGRGAL